MPNDSNLDLRLRAAAFEQPDHIAVVAEDRVLDLNALDRCVDELADRIRVCVAPGARVAVELDRGSASVVAPFAVWRAGNAYVPLERGWPRERIDSVLAAADVAAVVRPNPGGGDPLVIAVDTATTRTASDTAYVMHTSGSTGVPKGVPITHSALRAFVDGQRHAVYAPAGVLGGRVGMVASVAFDSSIERIALAALGYTVHVLADSVRLAPWAFVAYVRSHELECVDLVPSHLRALVGAGLLDSPSLRLLIVGGEAFDLELWSTVAAADVCTYNVYGPTENTVNTTVARVAAADTPNIGHPLPGVLCKVLGADGRPVGPGEPGELVIQGPQLSPGYLADPDATARSFGVLDGSPAYWTGDLVRQRDDAAYEFLGRTDDQVKINGNRVELGDVLHHVRRLPGVRDAAVTTFESPTGTKLLVSIVVPTGKAPSDVELLRDRLAASVPAYLVPSAWMAVAELPLTTNLKLDHDALRTEWQNRALLADGAVAADTEGLINALWVEVLGHAVSDRRAHFFAVGGDSLAALTLITRVRASLGVELGLLDVVKSPTIEQQAQLVDERRVEAAV